MVLSEDPNPKTGLKSMLDPWEETRRGPDRPDLSTYLESREGSEYRLDPNRTGNYEITTLST